MTQGPVTVREVYGLYYYENTLVVVELTGRQLKDALDRLPEILAKQRTGPPPPPLPKDSTRGLGTLPLKLMVCTLPRPTPAEAASSSACVLASFTA